MHPFVATSILALLLFISVMTIAIFRRAGRTDLAVSAVIDMNASSVSSSSVTKTGANRAIRRTS